MSKAAILFLVLLGIAFASCKSSQAQQVVTDIPYVEGGHRLQVLDIYAPHSTEASPLPVVFWIHGGGWQTGDKGDVGTKHTAVTERGFVFVSTNYRLLPEVSMKEVIGDIAAAIAWVHQNITEYKGDPGRIIVGGTLREPSWPL